MKTRTSSLFFSLCVSVCLFFLCQISDIYNQLVVFFFFFCHIFTCCILICVCVCVCVHVHDDGYFILLHKIIGFFKKRITVDRQMCIFFCGVKKKKMKYGVLLLLFSFILNFLFCVHVLSFVCFFVWSDPKDRINFVKLFMNVCVFL